MKLLSLGEITIEVCILIFCMGIIRKLFQKQMNHNMRYFLWIFVVVRILLPMQLEIPLEIPAVWGDMAVKLVKTDAVDIEMDDSGMIYIPENDVGLKGDKLTGEDGADDGCTENAGWESAAVIAVWFCGVLIAGSYILYSNIRLYGSLKRKRKYIGRAANGIKIYAVPECNCLAGIFRPAIYVDIEGLQNETVVKNVIRHELQHYRAGDHYWQVIRLVCLVVQWHNPFVWWAYFASKRDCELACDARATKNMSPEKRYAYGNSLIAVLELLSRRQKFSCTTSMSDNRRFVEERLKNIMKRMAVGNVSLFIITIVITAGICLLSLHFYGKQNVQPEAQNTEESNTENSDGAEVWEASSENADIPKTEIDAPTKEEVIAIRQQALNGMSQDDIERLTENIKVANLQMEQAYLRENLFEKLKDRESLYWNYFDEKGEIQTGWSFGGSHQEMRELMKKHHLTTDEFFAEYGTPVMDYNRFHAENFMALMEELQKTVQDEGLRTDFQRLIDETAMAAQTHDVEHAENIYRILHDMDYFLLRYGPEDVGKYVRDGSTISMYYGALEVYRQEK